MLAAIPDHVSQSAQHDAAEVGHDIEDVTVTVRQHKVLDQLADRRVHGEYAECPPGAHAHHQGSKSGRGKDRQVDHLVKPGDLRRSWAIRGIHGNQLRGKGHAECPPPPQSWRAWVVLVGNCSRRARRACRHTVGIGRCERDARGELKTKVATGMWPILPTIDRTSEFDS